MTNFGFILGCSIMALGIWMGCFYINRGLYMLGNAVTVAISALYRGK
jgi:uncharacterized membrane protein YiaA